MSERPPMFSMELLPPLPVICSSAKRLSDEVVRSESPALICWTGLPRFCVKVMLTNSINPSAAVAVLRLRSLLAMPAKPVKFTSLHAKSIRAIWDNAFLKASTMRFRGASRPKDMTVASREVWSASASASLRLAHNSSRPVPACSPSPDFPSVNISHVHTCSRPRRFKPMFPSLETKLIPSGRPKSAKLKCSGSWMLAVTVHTLYCVCNG
mmetsp:Transcript_44627/g.128981  ORF Transcript_44627/g.128981 Transcript_44627/m.128981 type:complete len:210 (+) Transcript_44627:1532-2161(+)